MLEIWSRNGNALEALKLLYILDPIWDDIIQPGAISVHGASHSLPQHLTLSKRGNFYFKHTMKFDHWFSESVATFANVSETTCNATLKAFRDEYAKHKGEAWVNLGTNTESALAQLCRAQTSCILQNVTEYQKAGLATAGVLLGLLPTILAVVSPSMSELALLGVKRPGLAALLALGSPAVVQLRVFSYEDPGDVVQPPNEYSKDDVRFPFVLGPWSRGRAGLASVLQYLLTIACIVNSIQLVVQLSNDTVLSWGCMRAWPLWVWVFIPLVVHGFAAFGYSLTLAGKKDLGTRPSSSDPMVSKVDPSLQGAKNSSQVQTTQASGLDSSASSARSGGLGAMIRQEVLSCASHVHRQSNRRSRIEHSNKLNLGVFLNGFAGFLGFMHLLFGTVTFSGLLFISARDSLGNVAVRFLASAVICRLVVVVELAGLRGALSKQH